MPFTKKDMYISLLSLFILISLSIPFYGHTQEKPYRFKYGVDIPISVIGASSLITGFILEKKQTALSPSEISKLNTQSILKMDRAASNYWNPKLAVTSDILMYSSMASPLLFLSNKKGRKNAGYIAAISGEVFLLNTGITYLIKTITKRKRPFLYNPNAPMSKKIKKDALHSFFSGHTSTVSSMCFSSAVMFQQMYPTSKFTPLVWFAASTLPFATGILRVKAGKHFWTDVIIGYLTGAAIGSLVPLLHKNKN